MDLDDRIKRRQRQEDSPRLIQDYESLSPVAHIDEPSGRGPVFERLLDHLESVFDSNLPPNAYIYGPRGSGKSAVVTALFAHLERFSNERQSVIYTSTRTGPSMSPGFAYVDTRETPTEFAFYRSVLNALVDDSVPEHGISTDELQERLHDLLDGPRTGVVIAVDHVGETGGTSTAELVDFFAGLPSNVSWLAIGRTPPEQTDLSTYTATAIHIDRYRRQVLVDVLMTRASTGLAQQALDHDLARQIADWAEGNAHDALAALFVAADRASQDNRTHLTEDDVIAATDEIPRPSVSLARVLALPANKQLVLRKLVEINPEDRASVTATAETISNCPDVDLSQGTVKRFLYELAEIGIIERVQLEKPTGKGRPPSRVELRFPPTAFCRLYSIQQ